MAKEKDPSSIELTNMELKSSIEQNVQNADNSETSPQLKSPEIHEQLVENSIEEIEKAPKVTINSALKCKTSTEELPKIWWLLILVIAAVPCLPPLGICMVVFLIVLNRRYTEYEKNCTHLKASAVRQLHHLITRVSILSIYWGISLWIIIFIYFVFFKLITINSKVSLLLIP